LSEINLDDDGDDDDVVDDGDNNNVLSDGQRLTKTLITNSLIYLF